MARNNFHAIFLNQSCKLGIPCAGNGYFTNVKDKRRQKRYREYDGHVRHKRDKRKLDCYYSILQYSATSTGKFIIGLAKLMAFALLISSCIKSPENELPSTVSSVSCLIKTIHCYTFRDLNKNGKPDIYEDSRQPIEFRIKTFRDK